MAMAARESRRALALDVRAMVWQEKKFDVEQFIRTGQVAEYKAYPLPDTPMMREALAHAYEEKRRLFGGSNGGK